MNASETNPEEVTRGMVGVIRDTEQEATRDMVGEIRDMKEANKGTVAATKVLEGALKVKVGTVVIKVTDVSDTYFFSLPFFFPERLFFLFFLAGGNQTSGYGTQQSGGGSTGYSGSGGSKSDDPGCELGAF